MIQFIPRADCDYRYDYAEIFKEVGDRPSKEGLSIYRTLILTDLFFVVCFVMGIEKANHPFVVEMCKRVEREQQSDTLDVWARGHFKAIDVNEPVLTTAGWKSHGELVPGDHVYSPSGLPVKVLAKTPVFTDADCYRVTFCDGYSVVCSGDHLWTVDLPSRERIDGTNKRKKWRAETINTRTLLEQVEKSLNTKSRPFPKINVAVPFYRAEATLPIDPYVLGVWLGDGSKNTKRVTSGLEDAEEMAMLLGEKYSVYTTRHSNACTINIGDRGEFVKELRTLGVFGNKHIPEIYKFSSANQRRELLRGLMDTDGSCHKEHSQAIFCNADVTLAEDVHELCQGLGLKPTLAMRYGEYKGEPRPFYQVQFRAFSENAPFKLSRKVSSCKPMVWKPPHRKIVSVEPVESTPVSCIQVQGEMYLVGKHLVPTHNSTIITIGETLQFHLKHPDKCTGILAYARPVAKAFLRSIKNLCEESDLLKACFPDIIWENPQRDSPKWSEDDGLVFRGANAARKESTIEAWGLIEGMPTGRHFERLIFDDIETDDIKDSPDMMNKVFSKFEMAGNLGTMSDDDVVRIIGTYYSHSGPIKRIENMVNPVTEKPIYTLRKVPGSVDGTANGEPVYMSQDSWDKLKATRTFNSQQLCDPTPIGERALNPSYFKPIENQFVPVDVLKFMVIDPAGDASTQESGRDCWAMGVFGVRPSIDDVGASDVYLLDCEIQRHTTSSATDAAVRMYLRNGVIQRLGVEKIGQSTAEIHISNALRAHGRHVAIDNGALVILKPNKVKKATRIEQALEWPLNNGKIWYSTAISPEVIQRIKDEMEKFPFWHDDGLDIMAYLYDMIKDFRFQRSQPKKALRYNFRGIA